VLTAAVMAITFLAQLLFLSAQRADAIFSMGVQGFTLVQQEAEQNDWLFPAVFLTFNLVNATMKESLFRSLLLTHLAATMSRMRTNLVQSVLLGLWHIV